MFIDVLQRFGVQRDHPGACADLWLCPADAKRLVSWNPATEEPLGELLSASRSEYDRVVQTALAAQRRWQTVPAPQRGELVRQLGLALRDAKRDLGRLITLETGKILSEAEGEVQEMIDMCDFAVGLSRQLYGLTMPSERPKHRLLEQWHPLGVVGIITAFNFPVAVWAWNATLSLVCGNAIVWKPSPLAPLSAVAVQSILERNLADAGFAGLAGLVIAPGHEPGEWLADDRRVALVSATGSCAMGRALAPRIARRMGRSLLELGGNNAAIVTASANLDLALRAVLFAAVGTAGQRCTTLRRLLVHQKIAEPFITRLRDAYASVRIGLPWEDGVLMGPLISDQAVQRMMEAMNKIQKGGGRIVFGGRRLPGKGYFVQPTLVEAPPDLATLREETFAPILYLVRYEDLGQAIRWHNDVPQGLASAIFTDRLSDVEQFLSAEGSDCGIANVNVGTSGAEIGGAFGGEKETGGGREAGSDSWKAYMRRQTCTINWGDELPLAQGVRFDLG